MPCTCDSQFVPCVTLVRAALEGDRAAFVELLRKFKPLVIHISRRYAGGSADFDSDETLQDLALHLLMPLKANQLPRLSLWGQQARFCAWLSSVVARLCLTRRRGLKGLRAKGGDDSDDFKPVSGLPQPGEELENRDRLAAIERRVAGFPIDHQIVFWNHFIHGLTYEELGRILDKNERVLRRWMNEIKEQLADL